MIYPRYTHDIATVKKRCIFLKISCICAKISLLLQRQMWCPINYSKQLNDLTIKEKEKHMAKRLINIEKPLNVCRASAGTGKTFTLAAYYVGLLLSGVDYRSILAITFTNKATAEMRERIMGYLYGIAQGGEQGFLERAKDFMISNAGAALVENDEQLRKRAAECFRTMLLDYDNVQVQTIDSFLQTLLSGLASILKMDVGLQTELDINHVITTAVDQLVTTEMKGEVRKLIENYLNVKLTNETRWDVRNSIREMAKELYNESVQMLEAEKQIVFAAADIEKCRKQIEDSLDTHPLKAQINSQIQILNAKEADIASRKNGSNINAAKENIVKSIQDPNSVKAENRFRGLTDKQLANAESGRWTAQEDDVLNAIITATTLVRQYRRIYNTAQLTIHFSRDMQLMGALRKLINNNLTEANCGLLAQTASTLCKALKQGDADFILEKVGIRFKHVLIDEFQDTSALQWRVISQLLRDILANAGNTVLIVGDIKQSIYRWRNGDWHIMDALGKDESHFKSAYNEQFEPLRRNFRSCENVVKFNLGLFDYIVKNIAPTDMQNEQALFRSIYNEDYAPERLDDFYQASTKKGGVVRFRAFLEAEDEIILDMFDTIEQRLSAGEQQADMMILVRNKKEALRIVDMHREISSSPTVRFKHMNDVSFVSADSFLLEASRDVQVIMAALRYITQSKSNNENLIEKQYIEMVTGKANELQDLYNRVRDLRIPLFQIVNQIIAALLCDNEGHYKGEEIAYINAFLDETRAYITTYGGGVEPFIVYWDDVLHSKSIAGTSTNAIRIMTIHASKGLQSKILFVPFCSWTKEKASQPQKIWCNTAGKIDTVLKYVPIPDKNEMKQSAYECEYDYEHQNMRIDNLNMLYVALTRAERELYISAAFPITAKGEFGAKAGHIGRYILDYTDLSSDLLRGENTKQTIGGASYVEWEVSENIRQEKAEGAKTSAEKDQNPFSYKGAQSVKAELWSNDENVRFVQSQEGMLYTQMGIEAYKRMARMEEGTLCHNIFARLKTKDQLDSTLDDFQQRGEIDSDEKRQTIKQLISSAWEGSEEMYSWFTDPWVVKMEHSVFKDGKELRPDRVMINAQTNEAIVLDYKFGQENKKYAEQVQEYMDALYQMGHSCVRGYLWYARNPKGQQLKQIIKEANNGK